jgi:hypothetical protein
MTPIVYLDQILQVFESDKNLHIIGGAKTGTLDNEGKDVVEQSIHLVIPLSRALVDLPKAVGALPQLAEDKRGSDECEKLKSDDTEGRAIVFRIR